MAIVRLTDLDPKWISDNDRIGIGLTFECPCGRCASASRAIRIPVFFERPLSGGPEQGKLLWRRTGDTFEALTLSPSIDMSAHGHWHGWVQNGAVV